MRNWAIGELTAVLFAIVKILGACNVQLALGLIFKAHKEDAL